MFGAAQVKSTFFPERGKKLFSGWAGARSLLDQEDRHARPVRWNGWLSRHS